LDGQWEAVKVYPSGGRVLSTDVAEPNRLREQVRPKVMEWQADNGTLLIEMDRVFVGWLELRNMTGRPGCKVVVNVSTVAWCQLPTDICKYASNLQLLVIDGSLLRDCLSSGHDDKKGDGGPHAAEFNMQHRYTFGPSGRGNFMPKFSYHETWHVAIMGLEVGSFPTVVGHRIGNIGSLTDHASGSSGSTGSIRPSESTGSSGSAGSSGPNEEDTDGGRVLTGTFSSSSDELNAVYNASMETMVIPS